ncbi:D-alanyl-D-alanine carboxypeptidase/D-alanyl-D-alanine-endopeptidase (penicillin-binding protein 4) [Cellulophaga sp. RHA19]|uniref:D-alanyl-D-alanine carboxypeptidase/D-alanyl-D-alanine-endopeptidase n=1 Tax=Cellulophaga sp. RHA19 TaxID=1798237 RepID=UPI000C2B5D70|nr:D-alanyl-D-alanine carboxypeptidase [Cellulophaga sp. RHA19]PKB44773.1 D-alanyl-D-alanine carboxypeptidase/D-alanyl-D-alanine-endopeptidase (penicillin-binding protein 4) [Cellulophaga sp. RHA19]
MSYNIRFYNNYRTFIYFTILVLLSSCASTKQKITKKTNSKLDTSLFKNHFVGIKVYDPESKKTIFEKNSTKYFTPASNTKIFTLYTALKLLPEYSPLLKYGVKDNITYIQGTGNPTTLHPYFKDSTAITFFKQQQNIALYLANFTSDKFGGGWAWEDFDTYFSPERSGFPLYGNVVTAYKKGEIKTYPNYFKDSVSRKPHSFKREMVKNIFYISPNLKDTIEVPFKTSNKLTKTLIEKEINKKIKNTNTLPNTKKTTLYGIATDSIARRMMLVSDNFLAEQLLVMASSTLSDTLNVNKAIKHILKTDLADLEQQPRWVDGSGLSRYNLFTPASYVQVLDKMYRQISKNRLFSLFPVGGESGTLKNWYKGTPKPYIYAKSGSLGNNYSLSGYLITKSGKTLIFSFMNNHFKTKTSDVKKEIQTVLEMIRDNY